MIPAKAYVKWANKGKIRFGFYRLQNRLNTYKEIGLSNMSVTSGSSTAPTDIGMKFYESELSDLTGYNVSATWPVAEANSDIEEYFAYALVPDDYDNNFYYPINSYIYVQAKDPIINVNNITSNTAELNVSNLGCQVGWSGDLRNEDWFGFILLESNATQPTINSAYDVTPAAGSTPDDGVSGIWSIDCDLTDNLTVPFVGLKPDTSYCVYVCRGFYSKINDAGDTALRYCLVGGEKGFVEFTTQAESQEDKQTIDRWNWLDGGDKQAAYNALFNLDKTILFKASVWNDLVEKARELYIAKDDYIYTPIGGNNDGFNPNYTPDDLMDIALMDEDNDTTLTATRFNALRYCIGSYYSTENYIEKPIKEPRDEVLADEVKALATCLNAAINEYNNSLK